jgi:hypothetical protein
MYPVIIGLLLIGIGFFVYKYIFEPSPNPTPEETYEVIPDVKEEPIRRVRCPHCNYLTDVQAFGWKDCIHGHKYLPMYGCTNCKGNVTVHPCNKNGHMCGVYDAGPDEWTGEHHPSSIRLRGPFHIYGNGKPGDDP